MPRTSFLKIGRNRTHLQSLAWLDTIQKTSVLSPLSAAAPRPKGDMRLRVSTAHSMNREEPMLEIIASTHWARTGVLQMKRRDFLKASAAFAGAAAGGFSCVEFAGASPIETPVVDKLSVRA
jgi:hypothetical protein